MSDQIVGTSVLQRTSVPLIFRLWFLAQFRDGRRQQGYIYMRDAAAGGPDKVPGKPDGTNSVWTFRRSGSALDCSPSVNWISAGFHNGGQWRTDFVEMSVAEPMKGGEFDWDSPSHERGSFVHQELNLVNAPKEHLAARAREFRETGVIL